MSSSKQLIQETAVRLFNERGYDKVSLRDIAREAGIAIGSLTYHFKRKEDLLDAILEDLHAGYSNALDTSLRGEELLARLADLFVEGERNQARYPFYFENLTQIAQCSEHVATEARVFEAALLSFYRCAFETLAQDGLLRSGMTPAQRNAICLSFVTLQASWSMGAGPHANGIDPELGIATLLSALVATCLTEEAAPLLSSICIERGIAL